MKPKIVTQEERYRAQKDFNQMELQVEKRVQELAASWRDLPWFKVEKPYTFQNSEGALSPGDLFQGRKELVMQHFMFKIEAFRRRMGWNFKWVSSFDCDFNYDFPVSFSKAHLSDARGFYNYQWGKVDMEDHWAKFHDQYGEQSQ
jgi:predicted dithiol-disulfide oxidoreductase (DUF899 family)